MVALEEYTNWMISREKEIPNGESSSCPFFSIIIYQNALSNEQFSKIEDSIKNQIYGEHEILVAENEFETMATSLNSILSKASGDYLFFFSEECELSENALNEFAAILSSNPKIAFAYSDEDLIDKDGQRSDPKLKPKWSPVLLDGYRYTGELSMFRKDILKKIGGFNESMGEDCLYDMTLRYTECLQADEIAHINKILYHKVISDAESQNEEFVRQQNDIEVKKALIERRKTGGKLEKIRGLENHRIIYDIVDNPKVSIIIPSKNHADILKQCIDSIYKNTDYENFEVVVVDNGSDDENKKKIEDLLGVYGAKYVYFKDSFNFSLMCNVGAKKSDGEYVLFLNDDIEIVQRDWLSRMLGQAQQRNIGAVGAKLLYPDTDMIQHVGISVIRPGPVHNFMRMHDEEPTYMYLNWTDYDCVAVTGACMLMSKEHFNMAGGFDESFPVAYNDVELCMRLVEHGLHNVVRTDVTCYHYESLSRGIDEEDAGKSKRLDDDRERLYAMHAGLCNNDPFISKRIFGYEYRLAMCF